MYDLSVKVARSLLLWALILLFTIQPLKISAEEFFSVYDTNGSFKQEFATYDEAYYFYNDNKDEYDGLILLEGDKVVMMEYGIVEFISDSACSIISEYSSLSKGGNDYLNGCYGIDAVYIETSRDGKYVSFMLNGDIGRIEMDKVILHPIEELDTRISAYLVKDGQLYHNIMSQLDYDYYAYSLCLDEAPSFMKEGGIYYSGDGHYFYADMISLIDDLRAQNHDNALNQEAYYNYYQYLPYRSYSNYTQSQLEEYFYKVLGLDGRSYHFEDLSGDGASDEVNRSQLYGSIGDFLTCQDLYGSNGLMLLASAVNESAYGKSYNSFISNNLYSSAVYESEEEKALSRYDSIEGSIYAHAKYFISGRYGNHLRSDYYGTYFGNKLSGINVSYSIDPYYGERSAAVTYELDRKLGLKDKDNYALAIFSNKDRIIFYFDEDLEQRRFILDDVNELALIVLEENETSYKVRLDHSFSDEYLYDPQRSYAYVSKEAVSQIINEDKIHEEEFNEIVLDLNGGNYHGLQEPVVHERQDGLISLRPYKEGYEFSGFNEENEAQYRKIASIEIDGSFPETFEAERPLDLKDLKLKVKYEDGSSTLIPLDTDMISAVNIEEGEQLLTINYYGIKLEKMIRFSNELSLIRQKIAKALEQQDAGTVKEYIGYLDYPLSFAQIRALDYELMQKDQRNYVISDKSERYNLSISGLDLSLPDRKSFSFVADTYYVIIDDIAKEAEEKIYELAKGYGFEEVEGLDISFRFNYQSTELCGPAIVQIDIKDKQNDLYYSVYHLNQDGDIIKCRTTQSDNYIQFMIRESGPYLVLSLPSVNEYDIKDNIEDLSYENMGIDNHKTNFELMSVLVMALTGLIGITIYYIVYNERKKLWRDFRRSLRQAGTVQEEKPKN